MGSVVELPLGFETSWGICIQCLASCVQINPVAARRFTECHGCHAMTMRNATEREIMLIQERRSIERVLAGDAKSDEFHIEVHGPDNSMTVLSGTLACSIVSALLQDRLAAIQGLLLEGANAPAP